MTSSFDTFTRPLVYTPGTRVDRLRLGRPETAQLQLAHSDPKFSKPTSSAYGSMCNALRTEVLAFAGQVLFVDGDGHDYIDDQPMAGVANLRRVEVEGDGDVSYVKVRVDPNSNELFVVPLPTRF
jgi:hypothetical protein